MKWAVLLTWSACFACRDGQCGEGALCIRGECTQMMRGPAADHGSLPDYCFEPWPNHSNCAKWSIDEARGLRLLESNGVPPFEVQPYCPFGLGQGYCGSPASGHNSTDCDPFAGMLCPCVGGRACPAATPALRGDVLVPIYQYFEFPVSPDPTAGSPKHMYDNAALRNGHAYQVIGAHVSGVQLKGPAEANGFNVDSMLIPLFCGGHVTPPVGPGPLYHFHKAADCLDVSNPGGHGPLVGYAADGFGIFGFGDVVGDPVLDECHGHFGAEPGGNVTYHYHASAVHNRGGAMAHQPYYVGCLGPALGKCDETVDDKYDGGKNWCGPGCGAQVCVQPGTDALKLEDYLEVFPNGRGWLERFTTNDYKPITKVQRPRTRETDSLDARTPQKQ
ncbi:hypothetical protein M885DRAFT_521580 [Pelagophyceae sp. CCMP2097]|nr:hypothetical protein M885DRAFT_521580 [Pelagophyceae sp. CCMP2097]|mmetsp:Transcript_32140/g.111074  ORF Transcript_32140/g.111074 Transcript_32140/m.111074 type:complete len:389 (-) Transcript_32140:81-1247(-)